MRWVTGLCCALVAPAVLQSAQFAGQALVPPPAAMDFSLQASDGSEFKLSQQRGKVVLLSFGYTFCPDVCPTTLVELSQVLARLGDAAKRVRVAFVTLDPERDTPERLSLYTKAFDPTFIGGTGGAAELAAVRKDYGIVAEKHVKGTSYSVAHSSYTYLIDRHGRLRALMPYGRGADDYVHDLRILLAE